MEVTVSKNAKPMDVMDVSVQVEDDVSLHAVLHAFNAPISELQCWALIHQTVARAKQLPHPQLHALSASQQLRIASDGQISASTFASPSERLGLTPTSPAHFLASVGRVLYSALDFGLPEDEERELSEALEALLSSLLNDADDEGIELSHELFDDVIHACVTHSGDCGASVDFAHVLRQLVCETRQLDAFLAKVSLASHKKVKESESHAQINSWARLWMHVVNEMARGVPLRAVRREERALVRQYELTPFERLLNDIRFKNYKLAEVAREQRQQKDAHALILDFIRSRPPLQSAAKRQLRPKLQTKQTLYDKLMSSIRQKHTLRHVEPTAPSPHAHHSVTHSLPQQRRLIKADLNLRLSDDDESDDNHNDRNDDAPHDDTQRADADAEEKRAESERRFSLKNFSLRFERRHSLDEQIVDVNEDTREHVAEIWKCSQLGRALQCLSLTLQEVKHIRSVLTKAEIETLGVTPALRHELSCGKICFTCLKTRFSFLNQIFPNNCKLCERAICDRCATKMRIPCEQFDKVPIYMLSPSHTPPNELDMGAIITLDATRGGRSKAAAAPGQGAGGRDDQKGPLVRICRDCKTLIRHLVDMGRTNYQT